MFNQSLSCFWSSKDRVSWGMSVLPTVLNENPSSMKAIIVISCSLTFLTKIYMKMT